MRWAVLVFAIASTLGGTGHAGAPAAADPSIEQVIGWGLSFAGLQPIRLERRLARARWAGAFPQLRFRVARHIDEDGRATVRFDSAAWSGDLTAVDSRADAWRLQGDVIWSLRGLVEGPDELATLREVRSSSAARLTLVDRLITAYFDRRRAILSGRAATDPSQRVEARLAEAASTAVLDGLTGGRFGEAIR